MTYPYRMAPDCWLLGQVGSAIFNNIMQDNIGDILVKHGLHDLDPETYYPVDPFINALADMQQQNFLNLVAVGMAVINNMPMPDISEMTLEQKFELPIVSYNTVHYRDKVPGEMYVNWVSDSHVEFHHSTVWPDHLIYGYVYSFARLFLTDVHEYTVEFDEETPRQDLGGDKTIIHVKW